MNRKDSPQSVIDSYRKRQQMAPYFMAGVAILLVVVGIIILVIWFTSSGGQTISPIAQAVSPSPSITNTASPTPEPPTATATLTPTITTSPTVTETPTPSGPFEYTIQENDTCWDLAVNFKVDLEVLLALNNFGNACPIKPGDKIMIPVAGSQLPTETALPTDVRGVKIEYIVKTGDTLAIIASRFNTTVDSIVQENKITDVNKINAGDKLVILPNIVTPTATRAATITVTPGGPTATATQAAATATPTP